MNLSYSPEQIMLRDSAFRFVAERYDFERRKHALAELYGFSAAAWAHFAEQGWLALPIAEEDGGIGGDAVDLAIVMEALGSVLAVEPYLSTVVLSAGGIGRLGKRQQRELLAQIAAGEAIVAFAHGEGGSSGNLAGIATSATRTADGWRIDGAKMIVIGVAGASHLLLSARIAGSPNDREGIGLFLVPADTDGLTISAFPIIDGRRAGDVRLDAVTLPADALLGGDESAIDTIEALFDDAIAASCAYILGGLDHLLRETHAYVGTRVQFGRPIGQFQSIQHRLAEMKIACEEARAATLFAILRLNAAPAERARAASAAKVKVGATARFVAQQAVQLHGGMGVTDELSIGAYLKHVTGFELMFGTGDQHAARYARLMLDRQIMVENGLAGAAGAGGR